MISMKTVIPLGFSDMKVFYSNSRQETVDFAADFARTLKPGSVVAFLGDLGAGKTAFVSGLAKGLGLDCDVTSPTFAICNEYSGSDITLYHFDMYRVDGWDDLYSTGFFDCVGKAYAYVAVEWSENVYGALPDDTYMIEISKISEKERELKIYIKGENE